MGERSARSLEERRSKNWGRRILERSSKRYRNHPEHPQSCVQERRETVNPSRTEGGGTARNTGAGWGRPWLRCEFPGERGEHQEKPGTRQRHDTSPSSAWQEGLSSRRWTKCPKYHPNPTCSRGKHVSLHRSSHFKIAVTDCTSFES